MNIQKADHFAFQVSDLERAIRFYTEGLGLQLTFKQIDEEHHEAFAFLELAGANLELLQALDENNQPLPMPKKEIAPPYCPHIAIRIEDWQNWLSTLAERGIPIVKGPLEIPGEVQWLYVADPDENIVEYVHWLVGWK